MLLANLLVNRSELPSHVVDHPPLLGRVDVRPRLVRVIEKREHAVILVVRERVELVRVALGALRREPQHRLAQAVDAVEHLDHPEFLRDDRSLLVYHAVAEEAGGHDLLLRRVGQKVASDLLHHELVVGHVAVDRGDDPVTPGPHLATKVLLVTVCVGVAGEVEPVPRPLLTESFARKERVNCLLVAAAPEGGDLLGRRRQANEI